MGSAEIPQGAADGSGRSLGGTNLELLISDGIVEEFGTRSGSFAG